MAEFGHRHKKLVKINQTNLTGNGISERVVPAWLDCIIMQLVLQMRAGT